MDSAILALVGLVEFLCRFLIVLVIVCSFIGLIAIVMDDDGVTDSLLRIMKPVSWQLIEKKYQLQVQGRRDN